MKLTRRLAGYGLHFRSILEDFVIPFIIGFALVSVFFWLQGLFSDESFLLGDLEEEEDPLASKIPPTFLDKNGQLYLKRHGLQENEASVIEHHLQFTIQAKASDGFKTIYVPFVNKLLANSTASAEKSIPEPPGTIWPWPRIEKEAPRLPLVWVVTPTYRNPYQYAELTRVAQAIYPARKFVRWLVVDDTKRSKKVKHHITKLHTFLQQFKVNFTLLKSKLRPANQSVIFNPKGVDARRTALKYIRERKLRGVVYFADDDNTYDSDIFRQMQATETVSVWPTGAITEWTISSPVVDMNGKVVDFFDAWVANRRFPIDFASFAVNTDLIHGNRKANIPWVQGYEESIFLTSLHVDRSQFLPLAANATQVLTWHTKTVKFRESIDIGTRDTSWPSSVKKLLEKYDFLFEKLDNVDRKKPISKWKRKNKLAAMESDVNHANSTSKYKNKHTMKEVNE